jgi:hypothetical protein
VIVGNPPWAKPSWNEGLVLADIDPLYAGLSASDAKKVLGEALPKAPSVRREGRTVPAVEAFLQDFVSTRGAMEVTSSEVMNPFAGGGSNNLYRCFIDLSFRLVAPEGYAALIHQDGHLADPKSGAFRRHWYARIAKYFECRNQIKLKMFAEVDNNVRFSLNVYRGEIGSPSFDVFSGGLLASQIEDSYVHNGVGPIPAIKSKDGKWDTRGHKDRIINIDLEALKVIHSITETDDVEIEECRFIQPFSKEVLDVFVSLARPPKLDQAIPSEMKDGPSTTSTMPRNIPQWHMSSCWNETTDQKRGIIKRETDFWIFSRMVHQGPLMHLANPFYKSPRRVCNSNKAYDVIDHTQIPKDYLPRANYRADLPDEEYASLFHGVHWNHSERHIDQIRVGFRSMVPLNGERSLISALLPPGLAHIYTIESVAFSDPMNAIKLHAFTASLVADFLIKSSGQTHFQAASLARIPWIEAGQTAYSRVLRLNCLNENFSNVWNRFSQRFSPYPWSSDDSRLQVEGRVQGPEVWDYTAAFRTQFARRLALVEIDVLVAQTFGLSLDQLIEIYRIYFPVMQEYEAGTWYDQNGRIVWTCSKGLPGVGWLDDRGKSPGRAAWERILADNPVELTCTAIDDTMPGGPREVTRHFVGPFTQCDRIEDYRRAWAHFERLKSAEAAE